MNLGENIYNHRTQLNLSQGDLANALEVSRQSVSKWENNMAVPELDKLIKLSDLFRVSLDELVFSDSKRPSPCNDIISAHYSLKTTVGLILFIFGLIGFLLSVFWGDHLRTGEEIGEIISVTVVLLGISIFATHNIKVWAIFAVVSFLYSVICFGFLNITSLQNYLFVFVTNTVILAWFIILGLHANEGMDNP